MGRDGKSRQFGFVGFRSEEEAEEAIKFFHNSFIDTCRITCEVCVCVFVFYFPVTFFISLLLLYEMLNC